MQLVINGQSESGDFSTVLNLLRERNLSPELVLVELNGQILPQAAYAAQKLAPGDNVELLSFVGGG